MKKYTQEYLDSQKEKKKEYQRKYQHSYYLRVTKKKRNTKITQNNSIDKPKTSQ